MVIVTVIVMETLIYKDYSNPKIARVIKATVMDMKNFGYLRLLITAPCSMVPCGHLLSMARVITATIMGIKTFYYGSL